MTDLTKLLGKLDDGNDDLWTQDGEPTIAAASSLAGRKMSREEIRITGRTRGQVPFVKPHPVNHVLKIATAELAVQEQIAANAAIKARLKAARSVLAEAYEKWIAHQTLCEEAPIRGHLRRTAEHQAAGNVAAPVEVRHVCALDAIMARGGRRGSSIRQVRRAR